MTECIHYCDRCRSRIEAGRVKLAVECGPAPQWDKTFRLLGVLGFVPCFGHQARGFGRTGWPPRHYGKLHAMFDCFQCHHERIFLGRKDPQAFGSLEK